LPSTAHPSRLISSRPVAGSAGSDNVDFVYSRWMTEPVRPRRQARAIPHCQPLAPEVAPQQPPSAVRGSKLSKCLPTVPLVPRHGSARLYLAVIIRDQFRANELQDGGAIGESLLDIGDLWIVRRPGIPVHHSVRCQARGRGGKRSKAIVDVFALRNKYSNI